MMMKFNLPTPSSPKLLIIAFCLLAGSLATAQNNSGVPSVYNVEFRMLAWSGSIWELYLDPENVEPFSLGSHRPSEWFRHVGPVPIRLFKKGETVMGPDGIEWPRPVAYLEPPGSGKWLFLLFKDKDEGGNLIYRSFTVKDESLDLQEGYLLINLSELDLGVSMNEEFAQIKAQGRVHLTPKPLKDNTVDVKIAALQGSQWELEKSNTFSMPESGLTTVFITKHGRGLRIKRFVDQNAAAE